MSDSSREEHRAFKILTSVRMSRELVSAEAILKACYWFSRDFMCEVKEDGAHFTVSLKPKTVSAMSSDEVRESFLGHVQDFEVRERVTARTKDVRDLLLAKAFAESGVLEDAPQGVFGDAIEEAKPDGIFKILSNG
jgi:His-Xaa-Ser system protein HxsD